MPKWILIFIVIPFCIFCITAWTQENGQVTVQLSDEYLTEWLLLGPFDGGEPSFLGTGSDPCPFLEGRNYSCSIVYR